MQLVYGAQPDVSRCPGHALISGGGGLAELVSATKNLGDSPSSMFTQDGAIHTRIDSRAYLAEQCNTMQYDNEDYMSIPLLGKTLQFTVSGMGGIGCGCNVAFYLTSMKQNTDPSTCDDYYCDANSVCGVQCTEVDIMEANQFVWRSTLHRQDDKDGSGAGFGGTGPHSQTWTGVEYGPGGKCVDTNSPFQVEAHFPTHDGGKFQGMMVELTQEGSTCGLTATVGWYDFQGKPTMEKLGPFLKDGMTPVVSYWRAAKMSWLDGEDVSGENPCPVDMPNYCPEIGPIISNIQVRDYKGYIHASTMDIHPSTLAPEPVVGFGGSPVPPALAALGWQSVDFSGQQYYWNSLTGETAWELPA